MNFSLLHKSHMHKENYYYRLLQILFIILIVIAIVVAFQHYFIIEANSKQHYSLTWHIPFNLFYWLYWFFISPLIYSLVKKYNNNNLMDYAILYFVAPLILVIFHQIISAIVINVILDYLDIQTLIYRRILKNQWLWVDIVIYFIIEIGIYVAESLEKNKKEEIKLLQLKNNITESQINILRSQIHPHFLFNTFNTLSTLILKDDRTSTIKLINTIKELLNKSVSVNNNSLISLHDELKFVSNYLEIEKLRFGERLTVEIDVDENALNAFVPNFILQPLVENSIRHGISKQVSKGIIKINSYKEDEHLIITVEDNGQGISENENYIEKGLGLKIIKKQLEYFFGDDNSLKYQNFILELQKSVLGGVKVFIEIPFVIDKKEIVESNEIK